MILKYRSLVPQSVIGIFGPLLVIDHSLIETTQSTLLDEVRTLYERWLVGSVNIPPFAVKEFVGVVTRALVSHKHTVKLVNILPEV